MGFVKKSGRNISMKLSSMEMRERGYWKLLVRVTNEQDTPRISLVWADRERRYFISTAWTTHPGKTITRTRYRSADDMSQKFRLEVEVPEILELHCSTCAQTDLDNRCNKTAGDWNENLRSMRGL